MIISTSSHRIQLGWKPFVKSVALTPFFWFFWLLDTLKNLRCTEFGIR